VRAPTCIHLLSMRRGGLACVCGSRSRCRFLLAGRANARQQRGADLARTVHTDRCTGDASLLSRLGFALLCVQSRPARTIRTGLLQDRNSDRLQALRQPKWFRDPKWSCHPLYPVSPVCPTLTWRSYSTGSRLRLERYSAVGTVLYTPMHLQLPLCTRRLTVIPRSPLSRLVQAFPQSL
jgi:hypothetical protein